VPKVVVRRKNGAQYLLILKSKIERSDTIMLGTLAHSFITIEQKYGKIVL